MVGNATQQDEQIFRCGVLPALPWHCSSALSMRGGQEAVRTKETSEVGVPENRTPPCRRRRSIHKNVAQ